MISYNLPDAERQAIFARLGDIRRDLDLIMKRKDESKDRAYWAARDALIAERDTLGARLDACAVKVADPPRPTPAAQAKAALADRAAQNAARWAVPTKAARAAASEQALFHAIVAGAERELTAAGIRKLIERLAQ
jgi:hypothetical protein